jgi:hypothetical protein
MSKSKKLTKRQLAVLEDMFTAELDEAEILKKHGVKPALYQKWLADEQFIGYFERRIAQAYHSSRVLLARYASLAAGRLIGLTMCDQKETARKACLDIMFPESPTAADRVPSQEVEKADEDLRLTPAIPPETASRILATLAGASLAECDTERLRRGASGLPSQ